MSGPIAVVFPGQGAQRPGMGADYHERFAVARQVFAEASDAVGEDLTAICFGQDRRLRLTEWTQPCLLATEIAAYRVACEEYGLVAEVFGGHSVGEYTALVAAGAIPFADAVRLVHTRGALMQEAVPPGQGGMAALLHADIEATGAIAIARTFRAEVANLNSPAQVAVSGPADGLEQARRALEEFLPDVEYVPLRVSAPFHSRYMRPAEEAFAPHVEACAARFVPDRAAAVTSNLTGDFHRPADLVANLVRQVAAPVRWRDDMEALAARASRIVELGPRGSLSKFFRAAGHEATPVTKVVEADERLPGITGTRPSAPAGPGGLGDAAAPLVRPQDLGDPRFGVDHGTAVAYAAAGLGWGVSGPELVARSATGGLLAFLGSAGLGVDQVEHAVERALVAVPPGAPWGLTVAHGGRPGADAALVDVAVRHGVPSIELTGFTEPTDDVVRLRLAGLRHGPDGRPAPARRLLAEAPSVEVAARFLAPPPEPAVRRLLARGLVTPEEAGLAPFVLVADDVGVAPDEGEAAPALALALLPAVAARRDEAAKRHHPPVRARVGAAVGLGTPEAVAAAFALGADFVVTGSVNRATAEAATSDLAKDLLTRAGVDDVTTAPDLERVELGGRVAVLGRGVLFAARADALDRTYRRTGAAEDLDALRSYLADGLRWAAEGDAGHRLDLQLRCGPDLGAFNAAVGGGEMAHWRDRHVDDVGWFLMRRAAAVLDEQWRRLAGRAAAARGPQVTRTAKGPAHGE